MIRRILKNQIPGKNARGWRAKPNMFDNKGKRLQVQAVEAVLNSLDKGQLIAMTRMQHVFDVLGAEITVPEGRMAALLEQMIKQGALARGDTMEIDRKFRKQKDAKASAVAKSALGYMVVSNDGKVVSKNKLISGPMKDGRYRKDIPSPTYRPHGSRFLQGQACGPARPVMHNFVVDTRECGLGVDIAENSPEFNESCKKSKRSVRKS
uniref:Uncharacterized protein n=1 Tax=Romanomermis culicivorax TaxID=13658 RepID=A0A915IQ59_ROMCU